MCSTIVRKEGDNKLIAIQTPKEPGQKETKIIREFTDNGIHVQMICEDVTSIQFYERI